VIFALDVCYREDGSALVAAVSFATWSDGVPVSTRLVEIESVLDYEPGDFAKRELPCLMAALEGQDLGGSDAVVVDAYVDLDEAGRPGLGRKLFEALGRRVPVVGVAKTRFEGIPEQWGLARGASKNPLYVSAAGMSMQQARAHVASMHGPHRMPTMLRAVDGLCRGRELADCLPKKAAQAKR
jgi:deoxyribonuclease V